MSFIQARLALGIAVMVLLPHAAGCSPEGSNDANHGGQAGTSGNDSNSEQVFSDVTGGTGLSALWQAYRKSVGGDPAVDCDDSMWQPY